MVNYGNSIIYKLCCKITTITDIYIGSTTRKHRRKCAHKTDCNNSNNPNYKSYLYQFIRENGTFNNWDMIEIEQYKAQDKGDLLKRERYWIELLRPSLNQLMPIRTPEEIKSLQQEYNKEYRVVNRDKLLDYCKTFYKNNKEKYQEYKKEYNILNRQNIKERNTQYRILNKEKITIKEKEWKNKNKDKVNKQREEKYGCKIICDCGTEIRKDSIYKHKTSKKHKQWESLYNYIYS
jgi:hypothetical protein